MSSPHSSLTFALEKYPDRVEIATAESLIMESARQNAKRPAYLKLAVPDEVVKSLRGRQADRDLVLLVRVPREILKRESSPIVLPGEVD